MNNLNILLSCWILYFLFTRVSTIANKAAYYIRNIQDDLCITGGPIIEDGKTSIFKSGVPIGSNCSENSNQQWIINTHEVPGQDILYNLRAFNSTDWNKSLNVSVLGEFITYFPNRLDIYPAGKTGNHSRMYDSKIKKCYESMGINSTISLNECDSKNRSQLWILAIVNDSIAPGTNCTAYWSCNTRG